MIFALEYKENTGEHVSEHKENTQEYALLQAKNESLEEINRILEGRVKDLQSQNGFLIQDHTRISGQLDRLLMPSQEEQKDKPRWFEFWKR